MIVFAFSYNNCILKHIMLYLLFVEVSKVRIKETNILSSYNNKVYKVKYFIWHTVSIICRYEQNALSNIFLKFWLFNKTTAEVTLIWNFDLSIWISRFMVGGGVSMQWADNSSRTSSKTCGWNVRFLIPWNYWNKHSPL